MDKIKDFHLDYHIFSGVIDSVVYELEITILATQEKVSLPCYILPEDNPKPKILRTLGILSEFVKLTQKEQIMEQSDNFCAQNH